MTIFSRLTGYIKSFASKASDVVTHRTHTRGGIIDLDMSIREEGLGSLKSLVSASASGGLTHAVVASISERMLQEVEEQARKFEQTGNLAGSFRAEPQGSNSVNIVSDVVYANTWTHGGWQGSPPAQNLMAWMRTVSDFAEMDDRELRDVAWAIRYSFYSGANENSRSTLRRLDPVGERYFDYVQAALDTIEPEVQQMGAAFNYL